MPKLDSKQKFTDKEHSELARGIKSRLDCGRREAIDGFASVCVHILLLRTLPEEGVFWERVSV